MRLVGGGEVERRPVVAISVPNVRRKFTAGQWVFLCVPRLGIAHWHPFTIGSSGSDANLDLYFDGSGRWTGKVAQLAAQQTDVKVRPQNSACARKPLLHQQWGILAIHRDLCLMKRQLKFIDTVLL